MFENANAYRDSDHLTTMHCVAESKQCDRQKHVPMCEGLIDAWMLQSDIESITYVRHAQQGRPVDGFTCPQCHPLTIKLVINSLSCLQGFNMAVSHHEAASFAIVVPPTSPLCFLMWKHKRCADVCFGIVKREGSACATDKTI